jgi:hypothetical protein
MEDGMNKEDASAPEGTCDGGGLQGSRPVSRNEGYRDKAGVFQKDGDIWIIDVSGYGAFVFVGDEDDCSHMCAGKASWEGGRGRYWRAKDGLADDRKAHATAHALLGALRYGRPADQSNYGPHPNKAAKARALSEPQS